MTETELSFLLGLLLGERLPKAVREKITARIKVVEELLVKSPVVTQQTFQIPVQAQGQSPSTAAAMARHAAEAPPIVVSPVAQAALMNREQSLAEAMSGKPPPGRTSPRKF